MKYTKSRKSAKPRMPKKTVTKKVNTLAKVVKMEKPELKRFLKMVVNNTVAQAYGGTLTTSSGHYCDALSVGIPQGVTSYNRIGNRIKLVNTQLRMQFYNQTANQHAITFRIEVWKLVGGTTVANQVVNAQYDFNQFIYVGNTLGVNVYDLNSLPLENRVKSAVRLYSKTYKMPQEQYAGAVEIKTVNINLKYKNGHLVTYDDNGNPTVGQLALVILADSGNSSTSALPTGSNSCFTTIAAQSGLNFNYYYEHKFIDN